MKWDHVGIKTSDMERSLHFYCDILGLERLEDLDIIGKKFIFVGNDSILIEIEDGNPGDGQANPRMQTGLYHLAFIVENVRALVERLKSHDVPIALDPVVTRPGRLVAFVEDPDGVFIQLIELTTP